MIGTVSYFLLALLPSISGKVPQAYRRSSTPDPSISTRHKAHLRQDWPTGLPQCYDCIKTAVFILRI